MKSFRAQTALACVAITWASAASVVHAQTPGVTAADRKAVADKAIAFLRTRQGQDGSFAPRLAGPGVSAVVAAALPRKIEIKTTAPFAKQIAA